MKKTISNIKPQIKAALLSILLLFVFVGHTIPENNRIEQEGLAFVDKPKFKSSVGKMKASKCGCVVNFYIQK